MVAVKPPWFVRAPEALDTLRTMLAARYPTLHIEEVDGRILIRGSFSISYQGTALDWYLIELSLPDDYPMSPSVVREVGGRIPRELDRHVNSDGSLCLAVSEDMWIKWNGKFDVANFLEGPIRNFLIGNSLVELGHKWPYGERAHGSAGVCEFYREAVGIGKPEQVLQLLGYLSKERVKGHWPCPCGSGRNVRNCHRETILQLHAQIPPRVIKDSMTVVRSEIEIRP